MSIPHRFESAADQRLEIRLNREHKAEIEAAAAIQGMSVSAFTLTTALQAARKVRQEHNTTLMDDEERDAFVSLLAEASEPNRELRKLMRTRVDL